MTIKKRKNPPLAGNALRDRVAELGISTTELTRLTGLSRNTVVKATEGSRVVRASTEQKLREAVFYYERHHFSHSIGDTDVASEVAFFQPPAPMDGSIRAAEQKIITGLRQTNFELDKLISSGILQNEPISPSFLELLKYEHSKAENLLHGAEKRRLPG